MTASKVEKMTFHSKILDQEMSLLVYLPHEYQKGTSFPVLYFLHGRSGDETILFQANINSVADEMIKDGEIQPMIIVCPNMENSRGVNSSLACKQVKDSKNPHVILNLGRYENYFIDEVVPFIDKNFNTIPDRNGRFIGGASAGGYAALHYAFRHQSLFSKVGGHMPALELTLEEDAKPYFEDISAWKKYDPIHIAKSSKISNLDVYLDAGDQDEGEFYEGCSILSAILMEHQLGTIQNNIFPGHHCVAYIQSNMHQYLAFYGSNH